MNNTCKALEPGHEHQHRGFLDLPDELVLKVLAHYHPKSRIDGTNRSALHDYPDYPGENEKVLRKFCLVSKRFYKIGMSLLGEVLFDNGATDRRERHVWRFINDPEASSRVRYLAITGEAWIHRDCTVDWKLLIGDDIRRAAEKVEIEDKNKWIEKLIDREDDSILAMLVSLLPNLKCICFGVDAGLHDEFPWTLAILENPANRERFSKLQDVRTIFQNDQEHGWNPTGIAHLMQLPSLRQVHLLRGWDGREGSGWHLATRDIDGPRGWRSGPLAWPRRSSGLEKLNLDWCDVDDDFMANMLGACKNLKYFKYEWAERCTDAAGAVRLCDNLQTQKETLETLVLDTTSAYTFDRYLTNDIQPFGSLKAFTNLRRIEISGVLIVGTIFYRHFPANSDESDSDEFDDEDDYQDSDEDSSSDDDDSHDNHVQATSSTSSPRAPDYAVIADMFPLSLEVLIINDPGKKMSYIMPFLEHLTARICAQGKGGARKDKGLPSLRTIDLSRWWGSEPAQYVEEFRDLFCCLLAFDVDLFIPDASYSSDLEWSDEDNAFTVDEDKLVRRLRAAAWEVS